MSIRRHRKRLARHFRKNPNLFRALEFAILFLLAVFSVLLVLLIYHITDDQRAVKESGTPAAEISSAESTAPEESTPEETLPEETSPEETTDAPTESGTVPPVPTETVPPTVQPTVPPTVAPTVPPTVRPTTPPTPVVQDGKRVFIGDSRFVGMELYTAHDAGKDRFIAKTGEGYDWFVSEGLAEFRALLATEKVSKVYINLGVNDCAGSYRVEGAYPAGSYSALINQLIATYPDIQFYFISVGPSDGETYFGVDIASLNTEVEGFNQAMRLYCDAIYLDAGEYLQTTGFVTMDGIHYDRATCQKLYDYILYKSGE